MKCAACGYERRTKTIWHDEIVYFKSGKNKGKIKEIKKAMTEIYPDDREFVRLDLSLERFSGDGDRFYLFACPECGTARAERDIW